MVDQIEKSLRGINSSLRIIVFSALAVVCIWLVRGMYKAALAEDYRRLQESEETLERMQDQRLERLFNSVY